MKHDEVTWVDSVPVRQPRAKRITISEYEWLRMSPTADGLARLTARFFLNSAELVAILVEDRGGRRRGSGDRQTGPRQPRPCVAGRSYLLVIEQPTKD